MIGRAVKIDNRCRVIITIIQIGNQRRRVTSISGGVAVGVGQQEFRVGAIQVLIVDFVAVIDVVAFNDVHQAVHVGIV